MSEATQDLVTFVAQELAAVGNPQDAVAMAAYMKTDMPFYGVKKPAREQILRRALAGFPITSPEHYRTAVAALWSEPHREEKYLAIAVARAHPSYTTIDAVPLYRRMIVEGAWWDFVDAIAADLIGKVLADARPEMSAMLDRWIVDEDLWLRRTAILSQLRHKSDTDSHRLFAYSLRCAAEKEFFIRKAIGWALREYAKTDPGRVREFVLEHREAWSGLTYREATKHLPMPVT